MPGSSDAEWTCPYAGEHPEYRARLEDLDRRMTRVEEAHEKRWIDLSDSVSGIRSDLANLNGRVAGYLLAAGLLGAVVAIIAQLAIGHVGTDRLTSRTDIYAPPSSKGGTP